MKKLNSITGNIICISILILCTSIVYSLQEWITFPGGSGTPGEPPLITMIENNSIHTVYSVDIPGMWREQVIRNNITFDDIHLPEYGYSYDIGWPQVPNIQELFATPEGANENVEVNILDYDNVILDDYHLYPVQHPIKLEDINVPQIFDYDEDFYSHDVWYPLEEQCAEGVAPGTFRDFDVITSVLYPMKFNPYQRELEVRHHIVVEIRYIGTLGGDYWSKYNPSKSFQKMYPYLLTNINGPWIWDFNKDNKISLNPDYLIIYDDMFFGQPGFGETLNALITYLQARYYNPIAFRLSDAGGNDPVAIWNFIKQKWNDWHIEYVLLIGDDPKSGDIPPEYGIEMPHWTRNIDNTYLAPSDIGYARLTGSDNPLLTDVYPDIIVGRMPVDSVEEFTNIVNKTKDYHNNNTPEKEPWEDRALLVAGRQDTEFKNTKDFIKFYGNYLYPPTNNYPERGFIDCYGIDGKTNDDLIYEINRGHSIINYYGNGALELWFQWSYTSENWLKDQIYQLTNSALPCVFQYTSNVGLLDNIDTGDTFESLSEEWLNAGVGDIDKTGAVACCGATRNLSLEYQKLRYCDMLWFRFIYGTHNTGGLNEHLPIKEFGAVVYGGIIEYMFKYTSLKYEQQQGIMDDMFYPDIIQIYAEPSLSMRDDVGEGTLNKEQSDIKAMNITPLSISSIYPNPLYADNLNIDIISISNQNNVNIVVYDISGRLVSSDIVNLTLGINKIKIDTSLLSSGVYILDVSSENISVSKKFVKVK
jgi:hypothetical protein